MKSFVTLMARALVKVTLKLSVLVMGSLICFGQGTFKVYDQKAPFPVSHGHSHDDMRYIRLVENSPLGQSFVPKTGEAGFVELALYCAWLSSPPLEPETIVVNLHEGGLGGPLLASTEPVTLPYNKQFSRFVQEFMFPSSVRVVPGQVYFF